MREFINSAVFQVESWSVRKSLALFVQLPVHFRGFHMCSSETPCAHFLSCSLYRNAREKKHYCICGTLDDVGHEGLHHSVTPGT